MATDVTAPVGASRRPIRTAGVATVLAVALASVTLPLAVTAPAVALNAMSTDLNASPAASQWVLNAYNVTFAACMLAAGSLADLFGRRKALVGGTVLFALMSLLCAVVSNITLVDVFRGLQGVGAAGILTSGAAVLANGFTGSARAKAFGVLGASFGFGLALGPLTAGALVDTFGWRSVFWLNVVIGTIVVLVSRYLPESRDPNATRVDWAGLATFSSSLFLLTLAFVVGPADGWASLPTLGSIVGFLVFLALFVFVEGRQRRPMFDLTLFRRPTFVAVVCQPFTITFGFVVLLVYLPTYFQGVGGIGTAASGALLLPLTVPVLLIPLLAGPVAARIPLRVMLACSSLLIAAGSLWLVVLSPTASWPQLVGPLLVFGIGVGSAFGVMDNAAVSVVSHERAGMASGIFNTMRITGEGIAIAGAASLLATLTAAGITQQVTAIDGTATSAAGEVVRGHIAAAVSSLGGSTVDARTVLASSLTSAMHTVFVALAVLALAGALATFVVIKDKDLNQSS
jgi:EmrB/QacA subfamily drug resistance transporter